VVFCFTQYKLQVIEAKRYIVELTNIALYDVAVKCYNVGL